MYVAVTSIIEGVGALFAGVVTERPSGVAPETDGDGCKKGDVDVESLAPKGMFQISRLEFCQLSIRGNPMHITGFH